MAILLLVVSNNRYDTFKPLIPKVQQALEKISTGQLVRIESGDIEKTMLWRKRFRSVLMDNGGADNSGKTEILHRAGGFTLGNRND